jgi:hypothetical protein
METKINIAEILKDKPQGTKLYDLLYNIDVESDTISTTDTETVVWCTNETDNNTTCHRGYSEFGTVRGCSDGLRILLPSKEMRDWAKFSWKRGDVLVNSRGLKILFDRWANDNYTSFYAKTINLVEDGFLDTNLHTLASEKEAKSFIKCIEEKLGGKLNRETLKIEKQTEFKGGDIVTCKMTHGSSSIILVKRISSRKVYFHVYMINGEVHTQETEKDFYGYVDGVKMATDSEKQQLFEALAKKGKTWDAKKKMIVNLSKKSEFKPIDWCLMRGGKEHFVSDWTLCQFSHKMECGKYRAVGGCAYNECIPYNDQTKHLLGTTDEWKGCEQ